MRGTELISRIKRLAKPRDLDSRVEAKRGKRRHVTLRFGDKSTVLRNPKDELKAGTLSAMLRQLGLK